MERLGGDGMLEPVAPPFACFDRWVHRQLSKPTPRGLRWLDRLEDRLPVWALPWVVTGLMALLPALIFGAPALIRRLR